MQMKNKKADQLVLPESLKLIIAVLCLLLLIYLAWNLYTLTTTKSKLAQARETLSQIAGKINGLKEGQDKYMIVSPKDWYLLQNGDKLCICSKEDLEKSKDICCLNGAMEKLDKEIIFDSFCTFGKVNSCVNLGEVPLDLYFVNKEGVIMIANKYSKNSEQLLDELLEFKGTEGKSILELCQGFIEETVKESKVKDAVKEFFSGKENDVIFQITEKNEKNLPVLIELYIWEGKASSPFACYLHEEAVDRTRVISNSKGKEYLIVLKIGRMEEVEESVGA